MEAFRFWKPVSNDLAGSSPATPTSFSEHIAKGASDSDYNRLVRKNTPDESDRRIASPPQKGCRLLGPSSGLKLRLANLNRYGQSHDGLQILSLDMFVHGERSPGG
jgi:hypothetical protein